MKIAYADPPYIGFADRYPEGRGVDHLELFARLERGYDGWALSTNVPALKATLALAPEGVRIAAWVQPFSNYALNCDPLYGWEPVIYRPAKRPNRKGNRPRDWILAHKPLRRETVMMGQKSSEFAFWIFELTHAAPGDVFADLYPGSGAVGRAWTRWELSKRMQRVLPIGSAIGEP